MGARIDKRFKCFEGMMYRMVHSSISTLTDMTFSVFIPCLNAESPSAPPKQFPVLFCLAGLTCDDTNFSVKAGAQKYAYEHGIALVFPDTSPRNAGVKGEADQGWDFGVGAGFYVNAVTDGFKKNYNMYNYVLMELPEVVQNSFPCLDMDRKSITGHSMGGHGSLTLALKNPGLFKSCSAFSPICHPSACPWGIKAFTGYFGASNKEMWKAHDAYELSRDYDGPHLNIMVHVGTDDPYLKEQLLIPDLVQACKGNSNLSLKLTLCDGYEHGYFFVSTVVEEHIRFHAQYLNQKHADKNRL